MTKNLTLALAAALVGTVVLANLLVAYVDPIHVGFGQLAPAGVLAAGLAFTLRDLLQEAGGKRWVIAVIAIGAVISYIVGLLTGKTFPHGPSIARIAFAGAVAFAISELLDLAVYTPLRSRNWIGAVTASGIVGLFVDSWVFLSIAFGSLSFFWGQVIGKAEVLTATVIVLLFVRGRLSRTHLAPA